MPGRCGRCELMTMRSALIAPASSRISWWMPPWRTIDDTRDGPSSVSLQMMASASSADLRCCASKSGGTYSASITGVSGSTLTSRTVAFDGPAIITAVVTAGLARSGSVRSIGTRMCLYMAPSSPSRTPTMRPYCHVRGDSVTILFVAFLGQAALAPAPIFATSVGRRPQRARGHESLEPAAVGMELAPILAGEIDHGEARGRETLAQAFARLDIAGGDQDARDLVQARIVPDHHQRTGPAADFLDQVEDALRPGVIEPVLVGDRWWHGKRGNHALPGLARAPRARHQDAIRNERVVGEIGAELGGILATARIEPAVAIARAGRGLFGLGMSKQH